MNLKAFASLALAVLLALTPCHAQDATALAEDDTCHVEAGNVSCNDLHLAQLRANAKREAQLQVMDHSSNGGEDDGTPGSCPWSCKSPNLWIASGAAKGCWMRSAYINGGGNPGGCHTGEYLESAAACAEKCASNPSCLKGGNFEVARLGHNSKEQQAAWDENPLGHQGQCCIEYCQTEPDNTCANKNPNPDNNQYSYYLGMKACPSGGVSVPKHLFDQDTQSVDAGTLDCDTFEGIIQGSWTDTNWDIEVDGLGATFTKKNKVKNSEFLCEKDGDKSMMGAIAKKLVVQETDGCSIEIHWADPKRPNIVWKRPGQ